MVVARHDEVAVARHDTVPPPLGGGRLAGSPREVQTAQ